MKKIMIIPVLLAVFILSACTNPPIFAAIEQEVKLKPASVKGSVNSIVQVGNTIYASNNKVFRKSLGDRDKWSSMDGASGLCVGLASDGTSLYGVFGNDGNFKAYRYDSGWKRITGVASADFIAGTRTVFASETGRKIYTIKNGTVTAEWNNEGFPRGAARDYCLLSNGLYTEAGTLVTGSPSSDLRGICEGPGNSVLLFNGAMLYCYDGSRWTEMAHNVGSPVSIAYLPNKRLVLIAGKTGYDEIKLDDSSSSDLTKAKKVGAASASSSIPGGIYEQYRNSVGKWHLNPIAAFDYGSGYIIYAGAHDPTATYSGLWGFYNPGQLEWNRE